METESVKANYEHDRVCGYSNIVSFHLQEKREDVRKLVCHYASQIWSAGNIQPSPTLTFKENQAAGNVLLAIVQEVDCDFNDHRTCMCVMSSLVENLCSEMQDMPPVIRYRVLSGVLVAIEYQLSDVRKEVIFENCIQLALGALESWDKELKDVFCRFTLPNLKHRNKAEAENEQTGRYVGILAGVLL